MSKDEAVSDENLAKALGLYAGMVGHVLTDPQRWLGLDDDPPPSAPFPAKVLDVLRDRAFGEVTPASPQWDQRPRQDRIDWWVRRIGVSAGLAAAAPRLAGALSDRVPLQAALGASAAGLAVCATAREYGEADPADWVPLLAKVLFDRKLSPAPEQVPDTTESEAVLTAADSEEADDGDASRLDALGRGAKAAARTLWRLARTFLGVSSLLDERPRGNVLARGLGLLPVVGIVGGWLDERGGIRRAAKKTGKLLR